MTAKPVHGESAIGARDLCNAIARTIISKRNAPVQDYKPRRSTFSSLLKVKELMLQQKFKLPQAQRTLLILCCIPLTISAPPILPRIKKRNAPVQA